MPKKFATTYSEQFMETDIHYPKGGEYDFLTFADFTKIERYKIPYRCLYSKDINNLFMAGRCLSATHVGLGSPRVMHTTAQMGVVVGTAAAVCTENDCSPRDVYTTHLSDMKLRLNKMRIKEEMEH